MPVDHRDLCDGDKVLVEAEASVTRGSVMFYVGGQLIEASSLCIHSIKSFAPFKSGDLVTVPASELQASPRPGKVIALHEQFAVVALEGLEKPVVVPAAYLKRRRERPSAEIERFQRRAEAAE